ncbi:MAG TPA: hypothetical protein VKA82_12620 [Rubrobacter sp.]|nr:hypothetical protein [Rubrobacter sp.]
MNEDDYACLRFLEDDEHALAKPVRCWPESGLGVLKLRSVLCELLIGGGKLAGSERFASAGTHYNTHSVPNLPSAVRRERSSPR